jgi:hypothetical protein
MIALSVFGGQLGLFGLQLNGTSIARYDFNDLSGFQTSADVGGSVSIKPAGFLDLYYLAQAYVAPPSATSVSSADFQSDPTMTGMTWEIRWASVSLSSLWVFSSILTVDTVVRHYTMALVFRPSSIQVYSDSAGDLKTLLVAQHNANQYYTYRVCADFSAMTYNVYRDNDYHVVASGTIISYNTNNFLHLAASADSALASRDSNISVDYFDSVEGIDAPQPPNPPYTVTLSATDDSAGASVQTQIQVDGGTSEAMPPTLSFNYNTIHTISMLTLKDSYGNPFVGWDSDTTGVTSIAVMDAGSHVAHFKATPVPPVYPAIIPVTVRTYVGSAWVPKANIQVDCYNITSGSPVLYVSNVTNSNGMTLFTPPADDAGAVQIRLYALGNWSDSSDTLPPHLPETLGPEYWPVTFDVGPGPNAVTTPPFTFPWPSLKDVLWYGGIGTTLFGAAIFVYPQSVTLIVPKRRKH